MLGLILMAALGAQAPAEAAPATPPPAAAEAAKPAKPKLVCVKEAQLGSLMPKRICATPEEWERRRQRDADDWSKTQDRAAPCTEGHC